MTTSAGSTSALHPLLGPISSKLHQLEAQIAELTIGQSTDGGSNGVQQVGNQFVLVVLDSAQVSSYLGYNGGRAAARAVANLVEVVMGDLEHDAKWNYAGFIVHSTSSAPRASAHELAQGFDDGSLTGSFTFVSSSAYAERKVAALLSLHGLLPSCVRIIASKQFKPTVDAAGPEIVNKAFYLQDDQLGGADSGVSQDGEGDGADGMYDNFGGDDDLDAAGEPPLRVNPSLPIQAQEPRICTQWALQQQCSHGARCKHSHAYKLTKDQEAALRAKIKTVACVSVKEAGLDPCPNGNNCLYGHVCPQGVNCTRGGRCFFQGDDCHLGQPLSTATYPTAALFRGGRGGRGLPRGGAPSGGRALSGNYGGAVRGRGRGRGMARGDSWEGRALGEPEWADVSVSGGAAGHGQDGW